MASGRTWLSGGWEERLVHREEVMHVVQGFCEQDVGSHDILYERWMQLNVWIDVRKRGREA